MDLERTAEPELHLAKCTGACKVDGKNLSNRTVSRSILRDRRAPDTALTNHYQHQAHPHGIIADSRRTGGSGVARRRPVGDEHRSRRDLSG